MSAISPISGPSQAADTKALAAPVVDWPRVARAFGAGALQILQTQAAAPGGGLDISA